ncbi:MAG: aspartate carbamoyltransferase regulatory subunit [Alistipes sp.]|nr:aspartate carbamoyltransferase regulatory subunit [Candidatus Minthomonas equi]
MKRQKLQELQVAALENGTVIDHIPSSKLFHVVHLLRLEEMTSAITIGYNLKSAKMGTKAIIKVSDKFFTDEELNRLALVTPNVTLCIIRNYEVVEKKQVRLPQDIENLVKCSNPKCITNNEPMHTRFTVVDAEAGIIKCRYCNHEEEFDRIKLL